MSYDKTNKHLPVLFDTVIYYTNIIHSKTLFQGLHNYFKLIIYNISFAYH